MLDLDIILKLKVGDIILVHGVSTIADIIEDFQKIKDRLKGKWTHSMTVCEINGVKVLVSEADKLGICKTDFQKYLDADRELVLLKYKRADTSMYAGQYKDLADYYAGRTRYNFAGLIQQAWRFAKLLFNKKAKIHPCNTDKRFMCGSWSIFNMFCIFKQDKFKNYTAMAPIDIICDEDFEVEILK